MCEIWILRLFHRISRDKRVTSHLALAARALGAKGMYFCGQYDDSIFKTISKVNRTWGGDFKVQYVNDYLNLIEKWKEHGGEVIHLTMYGLPLNQVISKIKKSDKRKLVIVGGAKVPAKIYNLSDWNISVTNQPHSEISALALFLHEYFGGKELNIKFKNAKVEIIPQRKGKKVIKR